MNLRHRTTCRVCGSTALRKVIDLGEQHLQGSFRKAGMTEPPNRRIPCVLVRCNPQEDENGCGLLQMQHSVPPEILYSSYWYRSGTNRTMTDHLEGIVFQSVAMHDGKPGRTLDIGCNDGTMLRKYPTGWKLTGVDPSDIPHSETEGIEIIKCLFPSPRITATDFNIITSIAMFYDLESPVDFVNAVACSLAWDGVWVVEMSYMPRMLELNSYDTICHEHLEYYSLAVIENICRRAAMKVVRAELNESNGGSIRCFVAHQECQKYDRPEWQAGVQALRVREFDNRLDTDKPYCSFQERIETHRDELLALLRALRADGKRIHLYGASTKGNTILQWCGIDSRLVECAADRNPDKDGAFTLGTDIPIVSEERSRAMKPDAYLVLPWHFRKEFLEREQNFLKDGGRFIFPLPTVEVVGK